MNKSESINELATSLCKLQGELHDTSKETQAYNYKYSDLSQILTYLRPLMASNGLSVTQLVNGTESGVIGVETVLMHSSGQWVSSSASMNVQGQNLAQEAGKVITYLRRYSLAGIVGLTQTDNDAALKKEKPTLKVDAAIVDKFSKCESLVQLQELWTSIDDKSTYTEVKNKAKARLS